MLDFIRQAQGYQGLNFGSKKTEFLDKSSETIDFVPVFFESK